MSARSPTDRTAPRPVAASPLAARRHSARSVSRRLAGGGVDGNERLTTLTGAVLLPLLAVLGVTILRIGQLISIHLFVGLLLIGPVLLKMGSTGYRFARYYTGNLVYRRKGPPELPLRLIAPVVVATTVVVFVSGVVLLFNGPSNRGTLLLVHKVSFIVWVVFTALHVLGHLPAIWRYVRALGSRRRPVAEVGGGDGFAGRDGRGLALLGALVAGVVLAIVLIPQYGAWTSRGALEHHHHHRLG